MIENGAGAGIAEPTPTDDGSVRRFADFATLGEALDYAALGRRGLNFHDARGRLERAYPFSELRDDALGLRAPPDRPRRQAGRPHRPGRRDRARIRRSVLRRGLCRRLAGAAAAADLVRRPRILYRAARRAAEELRSASCCSTRRCWRASPATPPRRPAFPGIDWDSFAAEDAPDVDAARPPSPDDVAYLQYSSGSTRFPHGVVITHRALMSNLAAHSHGMKLGDGDRGVSWLPFYHDMGLVGCLLSPVANQMSADYLRDRGFRPPSAGLARPDQPPPRHDDELFADLRLRHLRAPRVEPGRRRRALRPVALAGRRQRRRHDPPRRDAGVRRRLRAGRLQRQGVPAELRPRRSDAWRCRSCRRAKGIVVELVEETLLAGGTSGERDRPAALPRDRQLRQAGARHGDRDPRRERPARSATARSARSGAAAAR